ncbi:Penicillin-binding protein, beta-lactamase class C (modular protein) [Candidatus Sulfopaludibacter sp. SbA4]|nr:Penicillin-binding protein, beta-lactamase class C (modular protein) [Candidatus Sulfopaludibacter sp. SbA4]
MVNMRKLTRTLILTVLFVFALHAQIPDTPAGRQFSAWRKAQDTGDRAVIQQFIDKNMPWGGVDQELAVRNQSGGYDVKKVEESTGTHLVVLVQERGPAKQFQRITMNVAAAEPYQIAGIRIQLAQPPPELAPPKMTAAETEAARAGAPFHQFSAWLDAFNSGDRARLGQFLEANYPSMKLDAQMNFRERTGGFELRSLEQATAVSVTGLVQQREGDQFARFTLVVDPAEPHQIQRFSLLAVPRPAEFPMPRMNEADIVAALRDKLEKDAAADRFSGAVLLALRENGEKPGKVLFSGAYGLADRDKKVANKLETRFRIGSMNKMFTAVSVLQLVQAGKIKLTDPLGKYITDYPNQDVATKVTIHQLLTHTGGTGDIFGPEFTTHRLDLRTLNDYVALYGKRAPAFEPGSRWVYSNYGMVLAGVLVERVSKQSYYDYVAEHVYKPAGMTLTGSEPESEAVAGRSIGYMRPQGATAWTPNTDTLPYRGTSAGGGYSTVGDLMKFADALIGHKLLNPENTELLITGKVDTGGAGKYAYGFEDGRKDGVGAVGHGGGAPGMNGDLRIYAHSGYVIAVLSNLDPPAAQQVSTFLDLRLLK